jgi:competence CoiA-like predicted nuclease
MPLRAFLDGVEIISIRYADDQWAQLKKEVAAGCFLTLPCCNQPGFLRQSSKGLKHFVHSKSENVCDWKPETTEHLWAKVEIVRACEANGWKSIPEFSENDWRADVLAIKNENRIAFEVQWSRQTMEETLLRQQRYKDANVRGCWFFRIAPKQMRDYEDSIHASKETPSFRLSKNDEGNLIVTLSNRTTNLQNFVADLLNRKIRFCTNYRLQPKQEVEINVFETECWRCKKSQHLYTVSQTLLSMCTYEMYLMGSLWSSDDLDKSPAIVAAVRDIMQSSEAHDIKVGEVKMRYSKTINGQYLSHGCYYCDAIFGDFFLTTEKAYGSNAPDRKIFKCVVDFGTITHEGAHWCYSENGTFCEH